MRTFEISGKSFELAEFDPYDFNPYLLGIDYDGIPVEEMPDHPLLLPGFGQIIAGPKFHDWLKNNLDALDEVRFVMADAYKSLYPNPEEVIVGNGIGHTGFAARPWNEEQGVELQVLGDCACIGPQYGGHFIREQFENGYAAYDLHNADYQIQRASLYAGLGHIAWRASGREPTQGKLF